MLREAIWTVGLIAAIAIPTQVGAQAAIQDDEALEDEARSLFEAGRAAYSAARYEAALAYFEQAYNIVRRPALLFNMGAAADRLHMAERALQLYRDYLQALPTASNRGAVERRIAFFEEVVAQNRAQVPTPEETARTVLEDPQRPPADRPSSGGDITSEWWFWTLIAVVVVGAGVGITAGVVASSGQLEAPLPGDFPATMALRLE